MPQIFVAALAWGLSACALAMAKDSDIKELLKAAGADGEPARVRAIDTLGELTEPAPEVVKTLSEQLQDSSATVRAHAAHALGRLGPASRPAVEALTPLVADPDAKVRRAAVRAWIRIRPGPKVTVPLMAKVLKDADPAVRAGALEIVAELGKPAVPILVEALKQETSAYWACLALGKIGPAAIAAKPELRKKLKDKDQTVALAAARALATIDPESAETAAESVPLLIRGLSDPEPRIRLETATALRCLGPIAKESASALKKAMDDKDELVRDMAAEALKAIGG